MIERRPFKELSGANYGWLDTKHHFSFADYYDPERMHWGALHVWNDDVIESNTGFPPHPHANMEIITMSATARSRIATAWAMKAALKPATCR
jgi:redox-sensitive bicupin YhaK (pirin superfamily)